MIPKIIHYIWLGGKEEPEILKKCKKSWETMCPDYEIKRWDESNLNIDECSYAKQAYEAKKFAFASDYFRYKILNAEGGIYLDTDVELIKPLDEFLNNKAFCGFEKSDTIASGLILGSIRNNPLIYKMVKIYQEKDFKQSIERKENVCSIFTKMLQEEGIKLDNSFQELKDITVYPTDYFCPINVVTNKLTKTKNTVSIHWYNASWYDKKQKRLHKLKEFLNKCSFGGAGLFIQDLKGISSEQESNWKPIINLAILSILCFLSFLWVPLVNVMFVYTLFCILSAKNANGIYYLFFLLPMNSMFRYNLNFALPYITISFGILFLYYIFKFCVVQKQKIHINKYVIVGTVVMLLYLLIPFNKNKISYLLNYILVLAMLLFGCMFESKIHFRNIALSFLIGLAVSTLIGLITQDNGTSLFQQIPGYVHVYGYTRFRALYTDPNIYAQSLLIVLSAMFYLKQKKEISRILFYISFAFVSIFGLLTYSKAFILLFVFELLLFVLIDVISNISNKKHVVKEIIICGLIFCILLTGLQFVLNKNVLCVFDRLNISNITNNVNAPADSANLDSIKNNSDNSITSDNSSNSDINTNLSEDKLNYLTTGRFDAWKKHIEGMFGSVYNFIFGHGIGNIAGDVPAHNTYIQLVYEIGVLGTLLFFIYLYVVFKRENFIHYLKMGFIVLLMFLLIIVDYNYMGSTIFAFYLLFVYIHIKNCIRGANERKN